MAILNDPPSSTTILSLDTPDVPPSKLAPPTTSHTPTTQDSRNPQNLTSRWPTAIDLAGSNLPCRLEGEVANLVVLGSIRSEINGHFTNMPIDGGGNISAFRFHNGIVDMKMRYIETERYKLERQANKALFGLYRNPYTHHPCVRAAVDSTANTNLVMWADKLLALKEVGLLYEVDGDTLETLGYDPFASEGVKSKTFTAHPKVDPFTDELVLYLVTYTLDAQGKKIEELWVKSPWCAFIHDCAITENWLILVCWCFEADIERMKKGGQHWAWDYEKPATFIVVPRRKSTPLPDGWKEGESRYYEWNNCMPVHTAGAWEGKDGRLYMESSRVYDNAFPFFPPDDGRMPNLDTKGDFARWEFDLSQPSGTKK
ncbi:hypothetical protein BCON_0076g00240 [Botryotinia convoluta]|uniref:Carotenoid oxygenase n=1 Tax=Botryotinia convoluta TaxID=54673 RepID=A0A4Z1I545_9HELO|nr:hypothetical protein BCON_0076g00240 [Botryotinia convoluta]